PGGGDVYRALRVIERIGLIRTASGQLAGQLWSVFALGELSADPGPIPLGSRVFVGLSRTSGTSEGKRYVGLNALKAEVQGRPHRTGTVFNGHWVRGRVLLIQETRNPKHPIAVSACWVSSECDG